MAYVIAFFAVEKLTPTEGYWVTDTALDARIPFVPQFIFFYVMWYPLFAAVGIPTILSDAPAFRRWMYYNMLTLTASLVFYLIVPNGQGLRPADMQVTGFSTWLLSRIWAADTPTNVFPSMHIIGCIGDIAAVFDSRIFRGWRWVIVALALLCAASTMFVKQHAILDAAGAAAFAVPAFFLFYSKRFFRKAPETL